MPAIPYSLPRRSITSAQLLTQLGLDHGLSVEQCLRHTGLSPLQLAELHNEIEGAQELQLICNLIEALPGRDDLGLQAGLRYQLTTYGIWGYALLSSQSFRQAADLGLRYLDLTFAFNRISLREDTDQAHLQLDGSHLPDQVRDFLLLRDTVAVMVIQRELTGNRMPLDRVQLSMPAPADTARFIEQFGLLPEFACAENRISFSRHLLDLPLPRANPHSAQLCEQQCQALLAKRQVRSGLAGQIRDRLLSTPGRLADMEVIASELNISSRTLRRRLEEQGSSFRQLQEEVRQALAEELLAIASLSQEDIAERLGYSEVSNFLHAFKRWKGLTPGQYRQTLG
ncbi:AraC family transcriptional regulator [Pseudomonas sp. 32.2.56]|uniref:AraC family transcriptional regulator n=1 Tax=Pseudomonas sp. 32.2.56 TaxID=2969303 RepID=UPI00214FB5D4|nr:AraC family transcriptional regulator [Pseudomonas sp. 32.2.56]MCR4511491.1 AraC family transcriptional regulator [Pseudomonas sp. 32.2.56]